MSRTVNSGSDRSTRRRVAEAASAVAVTAALGASATASPEQRSFPVSGTGVHRFSSAVIHQQPEPSNGMTQLSTDTVLLEGDLHGQLLYHVTSVFDFGAGTLVNTGSQIFSGTVAGSEPVMLHDDTFRFEVNLNTGETTGEVHLRRSKDTPTSWWFECDLVVSGSGEFDERGDALVSYEGTCLRRGPAAD
jgi:hypothetical protein